MPSVKLLVKMGVVTSSTVKTQMQQQCFFVVVSTKLKKIYLARGGKGGQVIFFLNIFFYLWGLGDFIKVKRQMQQVIDAHCYRCCYNALKRLPFYN